MFGPLRAAHVVALVALAGCVTPTPLPANEPISPAATTSLTLAECHQLHMSFPARIEDFASQVPPEFAIVPTNERLGTTSLFAMIDACVDEAGERALLMWIELPVEPAAALSGPEGYHRLVLQGGTDHAPTHAALAALGFGVAIEEGTTTIGHPGGAGLASTEVTVHVPRGAYHFTTARAVSSGAFGAESFFRWAVDAENVPRWITVDATESMNLGAGAVHFSYSNGDAAPPYAEGIAHEVVGATLTILPPGVA